MDISRHPNSQTRSILHQQLLQLIMTPSAQIRISKFLTAKCFKMTMVIMAAANKETARVEVDLMLICKVRIMAKNPSQDISVPSPVTSLIQ
uniref:Uncharacterized protein n=1 Tax=Arundo donax TaxID=35708 RepID=A0A0A9AVF7_ARUDO